MSYTDPDADAVQPEGQGGESTGAPPYAEYLSRIPEEARSEAEQAFKDWDAKTTQRFQEASEYRKGWEPYEELGVNNYDPQAVEWALNFVQAANNNPDAVRQWYEQYAEEQGFDSEAPGAEMPQTMPYDEYGQLDDQQAMRELFQSSLAPLEQQINQLTEFRQQQEFAQEQAMAQQYLDGQLAELKSQHPEHFKESRDQFNAETMVGILQNQYIDTDPLNAVPRAFEDYLAIVGQIEKNTLQPRTGAAPPPLNGGAINGAPEQIKTLGQARQAAMAFMESQGRT